MKFTFALILSLLTISQASPVWAAQLETATLAAGCFWGTEEFFRKVPGVVETQVGYTGGDHSANYEEVSSGNTGHAESLELKFDPNKIKYRDLLILFFKMHDPTTLNRQGNDHGTQYRSAIFTHSDEQMKTAQASRLLLINQVYGKIPSRPKSPLLKNSTARKNITRNISLKIQAVTTTIIYVT